MRKYVLTCDHCKKEIPGGWTTMRFMTGPLEAKEYDLCESCADEVKKWITEGDVNEASREGKERA